MPCRIRAERHRLRRIIAFGVRRAQYRIDRNPNKNPRASEIFTDASNCCGAEFSCLSRVGIGIVIAVEFLAARFDTDSESDTDRDCYNSFV